MIYVRLNGGLGNQMFQYAAGRALAARLGVGLALDSRTIDHAGFRSLTNVFDLKVQPVNRLPPAKPDAPLGYALWRALGRNPRFVRERGLGFNAEFDQLGDNSYLHGYWQSERYFTPIADEIRATFRARHTPSPQNADMAARIGETLAVSLHVRRGDYLAFGNHGTCSEAYYTAALNALRPHLDRDPTVFVFSDDPDWAKANLPLPFEKVVVDFNGPETDYEDMRLMTACDHNIIANSSFSWWAAWLNGSASKRVLAPKQWFADPKLSNPDITPAQWDRIQG